jgi:cyclopropane-fatty-acyl-phospholipid synthase
VAPRFTLVLNRPGALRRMFWPPGDLALGEAYLRDDFDIEGDMIAAVAFGDRLLASERNPLWWLALGRELRQLPDDAPEPEVGRQPARLRGRLHSRKRDRAAIQYHYDVGNDFYALWLDGRMVYSCAYFQTGTESIDAAQEAKLDLICRKLRVQPGERLLDVGCGWGGLVNHAAERYGANVLGVTLSEKQAALANERIRAAGLAGRARVELRDYRDLASDSFDKIVSVGMFEHVGRARLPQYFSQAYRLLKPRGVFLNHGIAAQSVRSWPVHLPGMRQRPSFSSRYVFPDGELVPIQDALGYAATAGFEVRDVESWREHYAFTLRHWVNRLEDRRDEARRLVDERTYRVWRLYMSAAAHGFDTARINVYQSLLVKPDRQGVSGLPWTRADWYR